jgi:Voltage gated chloride channel
VIRELLQRHATMSLIIGILIVKTLIWGLSLGSRTSGGVLAPVFMIGAALGALEGTILPGVTPGFWALVGLAGVLGGVMRSPLTGVVFPLELTHAWPLVLPLLLAATSAYMLSALTLRRSVLTEKIARRGLHLTREYSVDPLEALLVEEAMSHDLDVIDSDALLRSPVAVYPQDTLREVAQRLAEHSLSKARSSSAASPTAYWALSRSRICCRLACATCTRNTAANAPWDPDPSASARLPQWRDRHEPLLVCGGWLHILAMAFFVGGQLFLATIVVPVERRSPDRERLRAIARRFGYGTLVALGVLIATGSAMATHLDLWGDETFQIKLGLVALIALLVIWHMRRPQLHTLEGAIFLCSLVVVWIGLYLANGYS